MTPEQQALWQRLESFVNQIKQRHQEIMLEAEAGCREIIAQNPDDMIPLGNACGALDRRFDQLRVKLDDTWGDKIQDMFIEANHKKDKPVPFDDQGLDYKDLAEMEMEQAWGRLKVKLQADAYRQLWPMAQQEMMKPIACTNCGMELQPPVRHKSVTVNCPGCNAANQCIPPKAVYGYYGGAGHAFAEEAACEQRFAIEKFRWEVDRQLRINRMEHDDYSGESIESMDHWLAMEQQYWNQYGAMRQQITGESDEERDAFIKSRIDYLIEHDFKKNGKWMQAKGLV